MYGYPQSPRGYSSNYRYSQPRTQEYESFYNPIPLDFMIGQLDKAQAKYDAGYASAMEAKDAFGGVKVDNEDIDTKNQLVSQFVDNTDKMVKDQFGGDWGRAAKSVARSVSEVRNNEFWNAAANAQAERKRVQELADKYGAKGMIFGTDMRGQSTIDENGKIRKFAPAEVVEQGNWGDTARRIFSSLQPEKYEQYGLRKADIDNFLNYKEVSEITMERLQKLANDPLIQQVFQQQHPEFTRGFNELNDKQKSNFGLIGSDLKDVTARTLLGNITPAAVEQSEKKYINDPNVADAKSGGNRGGSTTNGITNANVGPSVTLTPEKTRAIRENLTSLTEQKNTLERIPNKTDAQKSMLDNVNKQIESTNNSFDFIYNNMQRDENFKIDYEGLYKPYAKQAQGWGISQDEFIKRVKDNFKSGTWETVHPGSRYSTEDNTKKNTVEDSLSTAINNGVKQLRRNFDQYSKDHAIAANVRVITGTEGSDKLGTYAGNTNKLLTDTFRENQLAYTTAVDNQQVESVLKNDRRYKNDKVDRSKTVVSLADGTIDGKFVQLASFYDKNNKPLGAEYIVPQDQEQAKKHITRTAMELLSSGNPEDYELGHNMYLNVQYGPAIQKARIQNNPEGKFEGITYGKSEIEYDMVPGSTKDNPRYAFFIRKPDGSKDYFEDQNGTKYTAADEDGIKLRLEEFQRQAGEEVKLKEVNKAIGVFDSPEETVGFLNDLATSESGGSYTAVGPVIPGHDESDRAIGKYQFMTSTLAGLGYKGITYEKFKNDPSIFPPAEQEKAIVRFTKQNADSLSTVIRDYVGKIDPNTEATITKEGILAAAHLSGVNGIKSYLESGFDQSKDHNDGSTKISEYLAKFSKQ